MSKAPPIPPEQRSSPNEKARILGAHGHRPGYETRDHGDLNQREQGGQGNLNQNLTHKGTQQDR